MNIEALMNEYEVARLLSISVATIRRRRLLRQPPEFVKIGGSVRYTTTAVQRLIESATCSVTERTQDGYSRRAEATNSAGQRDAR